MKTVNLHNAKIQIKQWRDGGHRIYLTSGGFDPIHVGHLRCIQETAELAQENNGKTVVVVNGDGFLERKKGAAFMPCVERCEIIAGLRGVDLVVPWDDGTQTVVGGIKTLTPDFFTKGGDRDDPTVIPEWEICQKVECKVIFGVGGKKIQSSSRLAKNYSHR